MKKYGIIIIVIIMAIGFAAVSTTLYITGQTAVPGNPDDFEVYFSDAYVNGLQNLGVVTGKRSIQFSTTLEGIGDTFILDYDITNGSKFYDADISVKCSGANSYLKVTNEFNSRDSLEALQTRRGTLKLEAIKTVAANQVVVDITCEFEADAIERSSVASGVAASPVR